MSLTPLFTLPAGLEINACSKLEGLLIDPGVPHQGIPLLRELEGTPSIILTTHDEYRRLCEQQHLPLLQKPFHVTYPRMNTAASTRLPTLDPPGPKVLDAPNPE